MFLGEFTHKLDSKNRLTLPSDFRDKLIGDFYISKGAESSLIIYTKEEFISRSIRLEAYKDTKKNRAIRRLFFSSATKTRLDKQGRILLNKNLLTYSSIDKDLVIIGNNTTIEIWAKDKWEEYIKEVEVNLSNLMDD
ncbi:MAG: division/cell wall cluster transcriptional repressor MraZ [Anaerococcus sp.]|nr:division/cell wall cluster transcriptional repressor MraZ [Anaerococcus sp.]